MFEANRLTSHILAAVTEHERDMNSQCAKVALQEAKVRGAKFGSLESKTGVAIRSQVLRDQADRLTTSVLPIVYGLQTQGMTSYRAIARALNAQGIQSANGRQWHGSTVRHLLQRAIGGRMRHPMTDML